METALNLGSGFVISWLVWILIAPMYGLERSGSQATSITAIFTAVSVVRSYIWRRAFNRFATRRR